MSEKRASPPDERARERSVTGEEVRGWTAPEDREGRDGRNGLGEPHGDDGPEPDLGVADTPDELDQPGDPAEEEALARERDEYLDALRRVQADFENYKKRILKQQTEHLERAAEALVHKLLPVLDTLDLAVAHAAGAEGDTTEHDALVQVASMLGDVLAKEGLERIDPLGQPFDPNLHEAVMHEDGGEGPAVSEVFRAGYLWKGRVLRPAMVKVTG